MTDRQSDPEADLVTVVIPARNEEADLGPCLDSVLAQEMHRLQVVVVDGVSTDRTREVVDDYMRRDPRVELVTNDQANISSSLNLGARAARGRWLVRVDAHSTIPPQYVGRAVARLKEGTWGGVGGRKSGAGDSARGRAIATALGSRIGVGNSLYHFGTVEQETDHVPFGAYPIDVVRQMNGWDEALLANEDYEFDYRVRAAGYPILFDPELRIRWRSRQTLAALFAQYYRYGRSKVPVAQRHPRSLALRHLAPPALIVLLAVALSAARNRPTRALGLLAPYLGLLGVASLTSRDLPPRERALVPLALSTMHVAWGLGFWRALAASAGATRRGDR